MNDRAKAARGTRSAATATTLLKSACERLPVGFALFDARFRLVASNPRFAALRGYPRKLVKAGTPLESFVRFDAERGEYGAGPIDAVTRTRLAALKRGRPAEREQALPDGRCVRIGCERLPGGGLLLTCFDVTDARRAAQRLRESEERYDSAMQAINEGVYDWDIANGTIYYSDRVRAILRVSPKELRSPAAFLDRVHPDDRPRFRAATVAHFKGETERFECDYRFRARDGSWRWARQHGVALRDARGRAYRMVGSTGDITELKEREEQLAEQIVERTAIGELLEAISRSAFDLDAVLRTLVESATRLCRAEKGFIFRLDGDVYRLAVDHGGVTPEFREFEARRPMQPGRESLVGRTALTKQVVHLEDVLADREYRLPEAQRIGHFRTMLGVPIMRDDVVIGVMALWKERVEPFTPAQIQLVTTFSSQASIAIENARLFGETREALERQTATAEILKVISRSPTDVQPVFDAIVRSGVHLFQGVGVTLRLVNGDRIERAAFAAGPGCDPTDDLWKAPPFALDDRNFTGRAVLRREVIHAPDVFAEDWLGDDARSVAERMGWRAVVAAPLLRESKALGAVIVTRAKPAPFNEKEIALLRTFADQAVIAIENVRLFNELEARNRELTESLEQQTATAEILRLISTSPTDLQPVLDGIAESAARLCDARDSSIFQVTDDVLDLAAAHAEFPSISPGERLPINWGLVVGRAVLGRQLVHVPDLASAEAQAEFPESGPRQRRYGTRTILAMPLLREGTAIGVILIRRLEVRPFTDKQVSLLKTFADQAVIAIQNVRLFNELEARNRELTESLEQQTATAEILRVISSSPTDIQPVLDAVASTAARLCGASDALIRRLDGDVLRLVASHGSIPAPAIGEQLPIDRGSFSGRAFVDRQTIHVPDVAAAAEAEFPVGRAYATRFEFRSIVATPLLREGQPIGTIAIRRTEARPFSEKQIRLLETFADQAVIAIENVRLFNETKEALDQLKASAEVLQVISSSVADTKPVFEKILESCERLFEGRFAGVGLVGQDGAVHLGAYHGPGREALEKHFPVPLSEESGSGVAILQRRVIPYPDVEGGADVPEYMRRGARISGYKSVLLAPMLWEGRGIGVIFVGRDVVGEFSEKEIALLKTFADQAVIAIQNARLFNETAEALERQTATAEILQVISRSPTEVQPVFDAIVKSGAHLFRGVGVALRLVNGDRIERAAFAAGPGCEHSDDFAKPSIPLDDRSLTGRAILRREVIHAPDLFAEDWIGEESRGIARRMGWRAVAVAPMLREGRALGAIAVTRAKPAPFSDKELALLRTFADQAVIAIQNARLFNETKEALERQTATAEILKVISASPTDVQPVFDAIVSHAGRLAGGCSVNVSRVVGDQLHMAAYTSVSPEADEVLKSAFPIGIDEVRPIAEVVRSRSPFFVSDFEADPQVGSKSRAVMRARGFRSTLYVPIVRGDVVYGVMHVSRVEPGPFPEQWVSLLKTFADQAVIAIENVRLFNETKEALERQTATADILKVISGSPTDIGPVLEAVAESAARLCDAPDVVITMVDGDVLRFAKSVGPFGETFGPNLTIPINRDSVAGRSVVERRTIQVEDLEAEPEDEYPVGKALQRTYGHHTMISTPMLRGDSALGVINVLRREVRPLSDKQIALLQTFADQAMIAIENVRLFNETKEALEQQTATADILKVMSASPTDVQPVFDAIASSGVRLFQGVAVSLRVLKGDRIERVAFAAAPGCEVSVDSANAALPLDDRSFAGRAVLQRKLVHVPDIPAADWVGEASRTANERMGARAIAVAPMLRENKVLGAIAVTRARTGPFSDKDLALLTTFADQAVIAIENVRLFNETKEALDQLKASAEVLQVISSSVADTQPVFDKILESCERLFVGQHVGINLIGEDGAVHLGPYRGSRRPELERIFPLPLSHESASGSAILERRVMHYPHMEHGAAVPEGVRRAAKTMGFKSVIFAPMLWEGRGIGTIWVNREFAGPFSDKEIGLLKTFADQAVIAIQNAKLFHEIQEKSHQLEIANQHKSAFLANMSHELRTPLNAVIGFSEMLAARYFGNLTDKQSEYVGDIHASGKHLLSLINDILDLSKIEAGRMELEEGEFDLRAALDNALTLVRERAQRSGVALRLETDPALGAFRGDERKLKQVVLNLLSNAVKFTPRGGAVGVVARQANGSAEIAVTDTGVGIAPQDQEAIFEAFRQVGTDVTRKREGTGLGLALTRRFVELHGGTICVASEPGKGSTFTVTLPLRHGE